MLEWVRTQVNAAGFKAPLVKKIELCLEEVLVNIISYAYEDREGSIELLAQIKKDDYLEITIKDRGKAFDPTMRDTKIDNDLPIEEREIGGLGIALVKEFMDEILYRRDGVYNVLCLRKYVRGG